MNGIKRIFISLCVLFSMIVSPRWILSADEMSAVPEVSGNADAVVSGIRSAFNPKTAEWNIEWPGRIAQHDIVYLSPPRDPLQGIPLGNGDVGVLFWCEDSRLIAAVNKCDLWDDASFGRFHNWNREEEDHSTTLRHAARIIIDLKVPLFSTMYISDFKARLSLADASMILYAKSPFGEFRCRAFVDYNTGVLCLDISDTVGESAPVDISIERFGSRTFSHWYSLINRNASIGLSGTEASADAEGAYILQSLSGGSFAVGGSVIAGEGLNVSYSKEHSHRSLISLTGPEKKSASLAFSVTAPLQENPLQNAKEKISVIRAAGVETLFERHKASWKSFWLRSYLDYGDDYLNNLWNVTMYYAAASQRGEYPGRFTNGLWAWNRDVENWNFYFHWNQQQIYWPLNAAGHHDLVDSYLNLRFNALPQAKKDAGELLGAEGAFISDVTERRGYNSLSELGNHTPVAEIALDFWRQYRYTGDKKFLLEKSVPFITEAAAFFESLFAKVDDGKYHAIEGMGYEGWIKLRDSLTELVYGRALFSVALAALEEAGISHPRAKQWKEIYENLAPLPVAKAHEASITGSAGNYKYNRGFFRGKDAPVNEIAASGWGIEENKLLMSRIPADKGGSFGFNVYDGIFPTVPSSPVYPSGLIGLKDKGTRMFDVMTATTVLYAPEVTGWDPIPIVMARLGLPDELRALLNHWPDRWQIYCNGWGHWGPGDGMKKDMNEYFRTNMVKDAAAGAENTEKFPFPMWPFRHMSMESMSVLTAAMNESLLQSYEGIIRVAPAFVKTGAARFTLHAEGGFIVSSEIKEGRVEWICVQSVNGNACKLENPWRAVSITSSLNKNRDSVSKNVIELDMEPGEIMLLLPEGKEPGSWEIAAESPQTNENIKENASKRAILGIPKMY